MDAHDHVAFLAGSRNRVRVLRALRERPGRGAELARRCSLSRSTVHRSLEGLLDRGWARRNDGRYRITAAGGFVLDAYDAFTGTIEAVEDRKRFLDCLDGAAETLPAEALSTATLIEATPENPHAPIEHYADVLEEVSPDRVRAMTPIVSSVFNDLNRPLVEAGVRMELVIDESVLEASRRSYPEALALALRSDNFELYVRSDPIRFGLALFDDDRALVDAYGQAGNPRARLDGTGDALLDWTADTYERFRSEAGRAASTIEAKHEIVEAR